MLRPDLPEQPMILNRAIRPRNSRSEIKNPQLTAERSVAEYQAPQAENSHRTPRRLEHRTELLAGRQVVSVNRPVTEIPHQQRATERSEIRGRDGEPPRRVQRT